MRSNFSWPGARYNYDNKGKLVPSAYPGEAPLPGWVIIDDGIGLSAELAFFDLKNGLLYPYVGDTKVYQCPAAPPVSPNSGGVFLERNYSVSDQMKAFGGTGWELPI